MSRFLDGLGARKLLACDGKALEMCSELGGRSGNLDVLTSVKVKFQNPPQFSFSALWKSSNVNTAIMAFFVFLAVFKLDVELPMFLFSL